MKIPRKPREIPSNPGESRAKADQDWRFLTLSHLPDLETAIAWLLASADPSDEASELLRRLLALTAEPTWLAGCLPSATWLAAHVAPLVEAPRALPLVATGLA